MYKDVFDQVKKPLVFINTWSFQWPYNVRRMLRFVKEPDNEGEYMYIEISEIRYLSNPTI